MSKKVMRLLGEVDGSVVSALENLLDAHVEGGAFATEFGEFTAALHGGGVGVDADSVDDDFSLDDAPPVSVGRRGRAEPVDDGFADDDFDTGRSVEDDEMDLGEGDGDGDLDEFGDVEGMDTDPVDEFDEEPVRQPRKPAAVAKPAGRGRAQPKPVARGRAQPKPVARATKPAGRGAKPVARGAKPVARGAKPAGRKTHR